MANVKVLEVFGEGKTDIGHADGAEAPKTGVIPILVHTLCDKPPNLRVKRRATPFLQGKGWWQKVRFAKRQAFYNGSAGAVFVLDTEGDHKGRLAELVKGRDAGLPSIRWLSARRIPASKPGFLPMPAQLPRELG